MTTMIQNNQNKSTAYNSANMGSLMTGFVMIILSVAGVFSPNYMGLQLSLMHCFILAGAGVLAIWASLFVEPHKAFLVNVGLGVFFIANAILGFLVGDPTESNQLLLRVAPGFLELRTLDHTLHSLIAASFLVDAFVWWKNQSRDNGPILSSKL